MIHRNRVLPHQFTFYLTFAPEPTSLAELVRVAGLCWTSENCFEEAEVRLWTGRHWHITPSMRAHAYPMVV